MTQQPACRVVGGGLRGRTRCSRRVPSGLDRYWGGGRGEGHTLVPTNLFGPELNMNISILFAWCHFHCSDSVRRKICVNFLLAFLGGIIMGKTTKVTPCYNFPLKCMFPTNLFKPELINLFMFWLGCPFYRTIGSTD